MKLLGSGIDIVELERINKLADRYPERFIKRILHVKELDEVASMTNINAYLAKRFAVKEAAAKALGLGIGKQLCFTDMYVEHDGLGKPILMFSDECCERLNLSNMQSLITISDERSYAVAHVLLYTEE